MSDISNGSSGRLLPTPKSPNPSQATSLGLLEHDTPVPPVVSMSSFGLADLLDKASVQVPERQNTGHSQRSSSYKAATIIREYWVRYRNKQMFQLIKHAICAAEKSLSEEVLRKVSPCEAQLLSDKAIKFRVRFRFGGSDFPPRIFFKVFLHTNSSVTYVSGKKMIRPHTEAAVDSLRLMGNRTYYEHMLEDHIQLTQHGITDIVDVSTLKDYIQYCSTLDETPSRLGGRDNCWRQLTLRDLPRYCVFRDIVAFLDNRSSLTYLLKEYPRLLIKPTSQAILMEHIGIISNIRQPCIKPRPISKMRISNDNNSSRRSNKTRERSERMKNVYMSQYKKSSPHKGELSAADNDAEEWEQDANQLYQWSQGLTFDDASSSQVLV